MNDFSKKTLSLLAKKGITLIGLTAIPGDGPMGWANATRGYCLNDNGTHRVLDFQGVTALVAC